MNNLHNIDVKVKTKTLASNSAANTGNGNTQTTNATHNKQPTEAERLVMAVMGKVELQHDQKRTPFVTIKQTGHTMRLDSSSFSYWLSSILLDEQNIIPRESSKKEAIQTLSSLAVCRGAEVQVWNRCAVTSTGEYVVDLCQADNALAVVIRAGGWQLVERPPVNFVRNPNASPLPVPQAGGAISPLWEVANIPEAARDLVLAWVLDAFRPDSPFPILELIGEEGTSKSTTQSALRKLIDPNCVDLRAAPKNREDVCVSASLNWLISYENLSHLKGDIQDVLCTIATGGGFSSRKLYSNGEEHILKFKNPIVMNGISAIITQQDLLSRAISIELPRITRRLEDKVTAAIFEKSYASLLGGIFDLLAATLAELPNVKIDACELPRMADYCKLGMAMYLAMGKDPEAFREAYSEMQVDSIRRILDADPVACAIQTLLENQPMGLMLPPAKILERLEQYKPFRSDGWPQSGKAMGDALRRLAPALSKIGIDARPREDMSRRDGKQWQIRLAD